MAAENLDEWRIAMPGIENTARALEGALTHMQASLRTAEAGKTQTRLTDRWPGWMAEIANEGKRLNQKWNPRLSDQASGLAAAGGANEVYGRKEAATEAEQI